MECITEAAARRKRGTARHNWMHQLRQSPQMVTLSEAKDLSRSNAEILRCAQDDTWK